VLALVTIVIGPWSRSILGFTVRMRELDRAVGVAVWCGVPLVLLLPTIRGALMRRSQFLFYVVATIALGVLCCGPVLRTGDAVILEPMPYRWLMRLPLFESVRVPMRFWMLGMLCFAVAAGIGFARYGPSRAGWRRALFSLAAAGVLFDGWPRGIGMEMAPEQWSKVERRDQAASVIELPLGPRWDAAATFRAMRHRRRVVNGVSGYDPPHYSPLQDGLNAYDPAILVALSTFGAIDVVVNTEADPDGAWARYAASVAGAPVATDEKRQVFRIPFTPQAPVKLGPALPLAGASADGTRGVDVVLDGKLETEWHEDPEQRPRHWLAVDLGETREVGGVTMSLGQFARDFPRRLAIDVSADGGEWERVWEGPTAAMAMLAAIERPRACAMRFAFAARNARFVRLRPLVEHKNLWRVAEIQVHSP
jgi:hypothetical protein